MSLSIIPAVPAMSSVDIAKLTGKEHRNVLRDIKSTLEAADIGLLKFEQTYLDSQNKEQPCYFLPRYELDLVVSGYSVPYRAAIIKRWHELEAEKAAPAFALPSTLAEALRLAADVEEKRAALALELESAAPKIEFHDTVTASDKVVVMAVAAQTAKLPFGAITLYKKLRELGVLISSGTRHNLPKQKYIEQGLFVVNEYKFEHNSGEPGVSFTTHVTQKGIAWLVSKFGKGGVTV